MTMLDTMETLCCLDGVSGAEDEIRDYILERALPFADELQTDAMGNILVFKKGRVSFGQTIMMCAHMDEVGLIITDISDDGYLHFAAAGVIDRRILLGKKVYVGRERVPGYIGVKAIHLTTKEERKNIPPFSSMFIDIGAANKGEAEALVRFGDWVAFDDTVIRFGDDMIKAKAIDDRCGCAVMLELLESELPRDCWFAFTVQEEVFFRGAGVAANIIQPDVALILEGTTAGDLPDVNGPAKTCSIGGGVVIPFMDNDAIYDRKLIDSLIHAAEKNGIRWQYKTRVAGGTDAAAIQRSGKGCRVVALSVPVRNLHSPACVAKISECEDQFRLAKHFLEDMAQ